MVRTLMASLLHCAMRDSSLSLLRFRLVLNTITDVKSLTWLLPRGFLMQAHPSVHLHRLEGTELMESSHSVCHLAYFTVSHVDDKFCGDLCYDSESDRIHSWVFVGSFLGAISSNKVCFPRTLISCSSLPCFSFLLLFLSSEDIYVYIPHFHWEQMNFLKWISSLAIWFMQTTCYSHIHPSTVFVSSPAHPSLLSHSLPQPSPLSPSHFQMVLFLFYGTLGLTKVNCVGMDEELFIRV